jgi:DNA-binding transcriptional LysR family regulator
MIAELRTFVAIARLGTFSQAADKVALTPAAVSGQIKRLEEHLGFTLFDRTGRSATLNAAGARVLPGAEAILNLFDTLGDPDADTSVGTLRIGAIAAVQSSILARALVAFRERYPKHGVHVVPAVSLNLVDQVDSGELDLAILIRPQFNLPPEIVWHTLTREPFVLIAQSECEGDDWRTLLKTNPFIRNHRQSSGGRLVDRFLRGMPFAVNPAVEVPLKSMISMVQNGLGVALVPLSEDHLSLPEGIRVLSLGNHTFYREIGLIRSSMSQPDQPAKYLCDCLVDAVGPLAPPRSRL